MINIVSVCVGDKYSEEYVQILHDMVARNMSQVDHIHWCVTEHDIEGVNRIAPDPSLPGWWQKVRLFSPEMPWKPGERIIYFDLDVAIVGRLEDLAETSGIIQDWHWPCYNSSVMSWLHGDHADIWARFDRAIINQPSGRLAHLLPKDQVNGGDQEWITLVGGWTTFPPEWFVSYRNAQAWPPNGSKAVIFHGSPKPHEIAEGWVPGTWKIGGLTSLPKMTGMNVEHDYALENVRNNSARDLEWFTGFGAQHRDIVIVGGAPSVFDNLDQIKFRQRRGAQVVALNNAWRLLLKHRITPNAVVMLDARPENEEFVKGAPKMRWFVASQCHPAVFDRLKRDKQDVVLWHNLFGSHEQFRKILSPWWDKKPVIGIPGGCTVGLRALWLAYYSGYRRVHVYGMDSSYADEQHHAYDQPLNDGEDTLGILMGGKRYRCARWMARQAEDFLECYHELTALGVQIVVHGEGLIPDMCRSLRETKAA